ncbi:MAG TPA: ribosomal L7Ae/L30e/S12e/Gadd45 family protein [Clostridia bacterium]
MDNADIKKLISNSSLLVGTRQVLKACAKGELRCVVLASDVDESLGEKILQTCSQYNVEVLRYPSKRELGRLAGIEVASAVVGIKKD